MVPFFHRFFDPRAKTSALCKIHLFFMVPLDMFFLDVVFFRRDFLHISFMLFQYVVAFLRLIISHIFNFSQDNSIEKIFNNMISHHEIWFYGT